MLNKALIEDIYPLSPMQEGMLFEKLYDADSPAYIVQMVYRFGGLWRAECFEQSWRLLSQRHASLRTAFIHEGVDRPVQVVLKTRPPEYTVCDLSHLDAAAQVAAVERYKSENIARGFDLQHEVLMRVAVFRLAQDQHIFVWSYSHLLIDGWSFGILQAEFLQIYQSLSRGQQPQLPPLVPYKEYIRWLQRQDEKAASDFWRSYLAGYENLATLPKATLPQTILPKTGGLAANAGYDLQKLDLSIDEAQTARLQSLATRAGVTLNTLVRAIWGLILARYNGVDDIVFGAVVSGRPSALRGVEQMMGVFINALPVRIRLPAEQSFLELLQSVQQSAFACDPYQYLPLARIQSQSSLRLLFDHALTFENYPVDLSAVSGDGVARSEYEIELLNALDPTHYDFDFAIAPGRTLDFHFMFNGNVYPRSQIERTASHLLTVIAQVLEHPSQCIGQISLLPAAERQRLLEEFNASAMAIPAESLVQQFERQVAETPDALALVCGESRWSYRALNAEINRIAHFLRNDHQLQPEDRVAVLLDRSDWAIIAIWAIYKAGGAFVPIDTTFPVGRIHYMLEDSGCRLVLSDSRQIAHCLAPQVNAHFVPVDIHAIASATTSNPSCTADESNLAYLIYTSGSTGLPKGCAIERRNLSNCITWRLDCYYREFCSPSARGNFAFFGSLAFDLTLGSYFTPLVQGATLHVYPQELNLAEMLSLAFHPHSGVDIVEITPGQVSLLKTLDLPPSQVRFANLGGEAVSRDHVQALWQLNPEMVIINGYGPTETTIDSTYTRVFPKRV